MITFIDPGLRGIGISLFSGAGVLQLAEYVPNPEAGRGYAAHVGMAFAIPADYLRASLFVIEHPRIYPGAARTDLNDLLDVVAVGAACATRAKRASHVFPNDWKGNAPHSVIQQRVHAALSTEEALCVVWPKKSLAHNVEDAIGIGLAHFKRLTRKQYPGATQ